MNVAHHPSDKDSNTGSTKPIVPTKLAHVVVYTGRFPEMASWYKNVLNAWASHEQDGLAFLTYDQEHHRVAIVGIPDMPDRVEGAAGFHHAAFTYGSLRELLLTHERLAEIGVTPYWAVNHGPTTSMYYRDPDGNRVELQIDNFDTDQEGIDYCASAAFAENPIGVDIDPAQMLQRLRAGESETALRMRPNIGPRGMDDDFPRG